MPLPRAPRRPPGGHDVDRELARAQGARRLLPWALASALGGGAIAWIAGGGPRGGAALAAVGLFFVLFLWTTSVARCPSCGAPLRGRVRGEGAAGAAARPESCAACGARF
jgi:hypothetical protein